MDERSSRDDRVTSAADAPSGGGDTHAGDGETPGTAPDEPGRVAAAEAEVESLRRQLDDKHDQMLRALAEADNIRRRAQRDREDYVRYAAEGLVRDLVPVLDNLDRALEAARAAGDAPSVVDGVELIRREFLRVLERAGVTRYSAVGQPFDPTRHEAVGRVVRLDAPADTVVHEVGPGYLLHGRVLRPAMVTVAAAPDEDAA